MAEKKVDILGMQVLDCNIKDGKVTLAIDFFDGQKKRDTRIISISDPEVLAVKIAIDIKNHVRKESPNTTVLLNSEELAIEHMATFISTVRNKIETIQNMKVADNYLKMLDEIKHLKAVFSKKKAVV
ncbi:hypothetical protein J4460_04350 [Candidatus Woesearchaeota archaeon]|nr:hypothetical protein [Candidatus Woesearchaeota archaeon]HIH38502.1 hypothetical protein [Candidatus Woesearchaeota archaeon]HIH48211.1 hypothetical protein [Candidatus Woesearchaeota archaeon]HIJ04460.1 hypothetical protein [Candidatus Woesearchaeota archaeon]